MSEHRYYRCDVCGARAWLEPQRDYPKPRTCHCMRCGDYKADHYFHIQFPKREHTARQIANISGYLRENPMTVLTPDIIEYLENLPTPTVAERGAKLLRFLGKLMPSPGDFMTFTHWQIDGQLQSMQEAALDADGYFPSDSGAENACKKELPFLSGAWAVGEREFIYLLYTYLVSVGLVSVRGSEVEITPRGWEHLESRPETKGTVCFVAMAFAKDMDPIWLGPISGGIADAGYRPFRVDQKEHNDDITDEIIAGIRTAKFVFADFTHHRGGVYYEAGFAAGLGIPVVRSVMKDEGKSIHFDTRQLNHIYWEPDKLDTFRVAIKNRIIATIGVGPLPPPNAPAA